MNTVYYNNKDLIKLLNNNDILSLEKSLSYANKKVEFHDASQIDFTLFFSSILQKFPLSEREQQYNHREEKLMLCGQSQVSDNKNYWKIFLARFRIYYYLCDFDDYENKRIDELIGFMFEFHQIVWKNGMIRRLGYEIHQLFFHSLSSLGVSYLSELYYNYSRFILSDVCSGPIYDINSYFLYRAMIKHVIDVYVCSGMLNYVSVPYIKSLISEIDNVYMNIDQVKSNYTDGQQIKNDYSSFSNDIKGLEVKLKSHNNLSISGLGQGLVKIDEYESVINQICDFFCAKLMLEGGGEYKLSGCSNQIRLIISEFLGSFEGLEDQYELLNADDISNVKKDDCIRRGFAICIDSLNKVIALFYLLSEGLKDFNGTQCPSFSRSVNSQELGKKKKCGVKTYMKGEIERTQSLFLSGAYVCLYKNPKRTKIIEKKRNKYIHAFTGAVSDEDDLYVRNCYKFVISIYQNIILFFLEQSLKESQNDCNVG